MARRGRLGLGRRRRVRGAEPVWTTGEPLGRASWVALPSTVVCKAIVRWRPQQRGVQGKGMRGAQPVRPTRPLLWLMHRKRNALRAIGKHHVRVQQAEAKVK